MKETNNDVDTDNDAELDHFAGCKSPPSLASDGRTIQ